MLTSLKRDTLTCTQRKVSCDKNELVVDSQNSVFRRILRLHPSLIEKRVKIIKAAFTRMGSFLGHKPPLHNLTSNVCFLLIDFILNSSLSSIFKPKIFIPFFCFVLVFSSLPPHQGTDRGHSFQPQFTCNMAYSLCFSFHANFVNNLYQPKPKWEVHNELCFQDNIFTF